MAEGGPYQINYVNDNSIDKNIMKLYGFNSVYLPRLPNELDSGPEKNQCIIYINNLLRYGYDINDLINQFVAELGVDESIKYIKIPEIFKEGGDIEKARILNEYCKTLLTEKDTNNYTEPMKVLSKKLLNNNPYLFNRNGESSSESDEYDTRIKDMFEKAKTEEQCLNALLNFNLLLDLGFNPEDYNKCFVPQDNLKSIEISQIMEGVSDNGIKFLNIHKDNSSSSFNLYSEALKKFESFLDKLTDNVIAAVGGINKTDKIHRLIYIQWFSDRNINNKWIGLSLIRFELSRLLFLYQKLLSPDTIINGGDRYKYFTGKINIIDTIRYYTNFENSLFQNIRIIEEQIKKILPESPDTNEIYINIKTIKNKYEFYLKKYLPNERNFSPVDIYSLINRDRDRNINENIKSSTIEDLNYLIRFINIKIFDVLNNNIKFRTINEIFEFLDDKLGGEGRNMIEETDKITASIGAFKYYEKKMIKLILNYKSLIDTDGQNPFKFRLNEYSPIERVMESFIPNIIEKETINGNNVSDAGDLKNEKNNFINNQIEYIQLVFLQLFVNHKYIKRIFEGYFKDNYIYFNFIKNEFITKEKKDYLKKTITKEMFSEINTFDPDKPNVDDINSENISKHIVRELRKPPTFDNIISLYRIWYTFINIQVILINFLGIDLDNNYKEIESKMFEYLKEKINIFKIINDLQNAPEGSSIKNNENIDHINTLSDDTEPTNVKKYYTSVIRNLSEELNLNMIVKLSDYYEFLVGIKVNQLNKNNNDSEVENNFLKYENYVELFDKDTDVSSGNTSGNNYFDLDDKINMIKRGSEEYGQLYYLNIQNIRGEGEPRNISEWKNPLQDNPELYFSKEETYELISGKWKESLKPVNNIDIDKIFKDQDDRESEKNPFLKYIYRIIPNKYFLYQGLSDYYLEYKIYEPNLKESKYLFKNELDNSYEHPILDVNNQVCYEIKRYIWKTKNCNTTLNNIFNQLGIKIKIEKWFKGFLEVEEFGLLNDYKIHSVYYTKKIDNDNFIKIIIPTNTDIIGCYHVNLLNRILYLKEGGEFSIDILKEENINSEKIVEDRKKIITEIINGNKERTIHHKSSGFFNRNKGQDIIKEVEKNDVMGGGKKKKTLSIQKTKKSLKKIVSNDERDKKSLKKIISKNESRTKKKIKRKIKRDTKKNIKVILK